MNHFRSIQRPWIFEGLGLGLVDSLKFESRGLVVQNLHIRVVKYAKLWRKLALRICIFCRCQVSLGGLPQKSWLVNVNDDWRHIHKIHLISTESSTGSNHTGSYTGDWWGDNPLPNHFTIFLKFPVIMMLRKTNIAVLRGKTRKLCSGIAYMIDRRK